MTLRLDSACLVTVYGGSGFLGGHIVRALAQTGCRMRIAVRRPDLAGHLQPLGSVGQIHAVQANLRDADSVKRAAHEAHALINLVGVLHERGKQTFAAVQHEGARNVAAAAKALGIGTVVHVSAIGASADSPSVYACSKAAGEQAVLETVPDATVMRPSIMFGPGDGFFTRFAGLARILPALPLFGGGKTRFQPVYAGDVAEAVIAALRGTAEPGATYELGGPEVFTFKELLERVLHYTQRRRLLVPVPFALARVQGAVLQYLPGPLLTVDQVRQLEIDNVVSEAAVAQNRVLQGLGIDPLALDVVVPGYLQRFRARGQFSTTWRE